MSENCKVESEGSPDEVNKCNGKGKKRGDRDYSYPFGRPVKRCYTTLLRPSYIPGLNNVRAENRGRLSCLLRKLMRLHNWKEASGVLSVLLKGTPKERSPTGNLIKYWIAVELFKQMESKHINLVKFKHIYEIWNKKMGSMKDCPIKNRVMVQLEFIRFCLTQGHIEEAHQTVICLLQEHEYGSDPILNMLVGLTFYQLWYSTIPEELKLINSDMDDTPLPSEMSKGRAKIAVETSEACSAADLRAVDTPIKCDSDTSVGNDKEFHLDSYDYQPKENTPQVFHTQGFYMEDSTEIGGHGEASFSNGGTMMHSSIIYANGLDSCLLPIRFPPLNDDLEEATYLHGELCNDYYTSAVKHLQLALSSTPPVLMALLPLVQLLLIGDQTEEALKELEKICHDQSVALPYRLRASIMECFDSKQCTLPSTWYEDTLKKDPFSTYSLARLITMLKNGNYNLESLVEMIALHIDATDAACSIWEELASCFIKFSQYEEDQMSICENEQGGRGKQACGDYFNWVPKAFTGGILGKSWILRCKWWMTHHFSKTRYLSELKTGDLQLLTFKAACASHLYGPEFQYVASVCTYLEEEDKDKLLYLRKHMQNSVGLYLKLNRTK